MMKKVVLLVNAFTCLVLAAKDEFVNVSGKGTIKVYPNQVTLVFGVNKIDKRLDSAVAPTARIANSLLSICKKYGVEERDIQTVSNSLERAYKSDRDTATYLGIRSEIIYEVKFSRVDSVNALLNSLYRNGMNEFREFSFGHTGQDSLKRQASILAIRDAFENANALASHSGRKIKALMNASYEKPEDFSFRPQARHEGFWSGDAGMDNFSGRAKYDLEYFKIKPGAIEFEVQLYAKYELQ